MLDRRTLLLSGAAAAVPFTMNAQASPLASAAGISAHQLGVNPGSPDDQTAAFQRAIDKAADAQTPLFIPPGVYRVGALRLRPGAKLVGVGGATRLILAGAGPIVLAENSDGIALQGLVLDGLDRPLAVGRGLLSISNSRQLTINACDILKSGSNGIHLEAVQGSLSNCTITGAAKTGVFSRNATGLRISGNTVSGSGNNGIQVWRSEPGNDGTLVLANRISGIAARDGGSGQYGNAVNVFRANGVIVANNSIRDCAYTAVRANTTSDIQILANNCGKLGEVALYVEFGSEGAVVANNIVDGASIGISMTNFNEGGRLGVAQGNLLRNLQLPPTAGNDPDGGWGIGIHVEADAAVNGNVVENAANFGLSLGWGQHLRDVTATSNVIRNTPIGVAVSVAAGAGTAIVKDNLISGATKAAVMGFDRKRAVTGDLTRDSTTRFAQLTVAGNVVR